MGSRKTADFFAREAKKLGYAARSALKLKEIQDRFGVMRAGDAVLDLGCHPGAWTQVASERGAGSVVGVDLTTTRSDALGPRVDPRRTTLTPLLRQFRHRPRTKRSILIFSKIRTPRMYLGSRLTMTRLRFRLSR